MAELIKVPFLGVNDTDCKLSSWEVAENKLVPKGTLVCVLETTKTTFDVEATTDGYLYYNAKVGDTLGVHDVIGVMTEMPHENPTQLINELVKSQQAAQTTKEGTGFTKKAEILIKSLNLDSNEILKCFPDTKITEALIKEFLEGNVVMNTRRGFGQVERIAIIGGVSGGGALIVIDSIARNNKQRAVCIFDQSKEFLGKEVLGVPVVGDISNLQHWIDDNKIDSVIIAFNRNLKEREKVFNELQGEGIKFANVIDPSVDIRTGVQIGVGNVILGRAYIGACSVIGDNNFISANVCLEHGNILGSHCAFGPGVFTSGNVTMGNTIRFGTGIFIEPSIEIGNNAIVPSGTIITNHVQPGEVVGNKKANK